jgi:protein TonB
MGFKQLGGIARGHRLGLAAALTLAIAVAGVFAARSQHDPSAVDGNSDRTVPVLVAGSCPTPEYPAASRPFKHSGVVMLNFLIGTDGSVIDSKVETSSGHPALDDAAKLALSNCRFKPGTVRGQPQPSWHIMKYDWSVER